MDQTEPEASDGKDPADLFYKFPSIENYESYILKNPKHQLDARQVIATEKIHGTHLQFIITSTTILTAKRNGMLSDEKFYDFQKVRKSLTPVLRSSWEYASTLFGDSQGVLRIFGELYGGRYPGIKSPAGQHKEVQTRIWYSPLITWRAFAAKFGASWMSWDQLTTLSLETKLPLVPVYKRGVWKDLKEDPTLHTHPIPIEMEKNETLFPIDGNLSEGVVLNFLPDQEGKPTLLLKFKNPQFQERATGKSKTAFQAKKEKKQDKKTQITSEIEALLVYNRVENYMTKLLPSEAYDKKQLGNHIRGVIQDAVDEYHLKHSLLATRDFKSLGSPLGRLTKDLILKWQHESTQ